MSTNYGAVFNAKKSIKANNKKRMCKYGGCGTILMRYNLDKYCCYHQRIITMLEFSEQNILKEMKRRDKETDAIRVKHFLNKYDKQKVMCDEEYGLLADKKLKKRRYKVTAWAKR